MYDKDAKVTRCERGQIEGLYQVHHSLGRAAQECVSSRCRTFDPHGKRGTGDTRFPYSTTFVASISSDDRLLKSLGRTQRSITFVMAFALPFSIHLVGCTPLL